MLGPFPSVPLIVAPLFAFANSIELTLNTRAALEGVLDEGFVWAGQVVGLINDIPTAQELIERLVRESWVITQNMQRLFRSNE